eukprot:740475-Prorocentrum_minimum.AAC.2
MASTLLALNILNIVGPWVKMYKPFTGNDDKGLSPKKFFDKLKKLARFTYTTIGAVPSVRWSYALLAGIDLILASPLQSAYFVACSHVRENYGLVSLGPESGVEI